MKLNRLAQGALPVAVLTMVSLSPAAAQQTIFEKHFFGDSTGTYINTDPQTGCSTTKNCNVALNGADALPVLVNPWEPVSIKIYCAFVIFMPSAAVSANTNFFAGNSYWPDIMAWGVPYPGGGGTVEHCMPNGTYFPFPAAKSGAPASKLGQNNFMEPHLDVHVAGCPASGCPKPGQTPSVTYQVYLRVLYTKNAQ